MSVKVRPFRNGGFEVDIRGTYSDGQPYRLRLKSPVSSKSGSKRWGEARERELLLGGVQPALPAVIARPPEPIPIIRKEVPTLTQFKNRFIEGYAKANRHKASGIDSKESIYEHHLEPLLGTVTLDAIDDEVVARLKAARTDVEPKTLNNILSVLNTTLKIAVEWKVIDVMPCRIKLLKVPPSSFKFYDFSDYARLVEAARRTDPRIYVAVLLGGDAGLRRGEIIAVRQRDGDHRRKLLHVERSVWRGIEGPPKGGRSRIVPMTEALAAALAELRHLRGERVLYRDDGKPVSAKVLRKWLAQAQRRAGLEANGGLHILRHTFCSHLAMRGAPAKAIQELAGHASLETTMRYMHLTPAARQSAIALLDQARSEIGSGSDFGDILETGARSR